MLDYVRSFGRLNRDVKLYLAGFGVSAFGYFGVMGVLFNLYLARLGFGAEFIGLLIGSGQLLWAILALPAGAIGARIGLSRALLLSEAIMALGITLLLFVEWLPRPLWEGWLIATWMTLWLGAALFTVNGVPFLMAATSLEERTRAFSLQQAVVALCGLAGSLVAGWLPGALAGWMGITLDGSYSDAAPYRVALWLAPASFVLATFLYIALRPVAAASRQGDSDSRAGAPIVLYIFFTVVVFLGASGEGAARSFFNLYLDSELHVPTAQIGAAMGIAQLLPVGIALIAPLLLARLGNGMALAAATFAAALCIVVMGIFPNWLVAAAALMGIQGTVAIVGPARNLFSQEIVPPHRRTTTAALMTIGLALGWGASAAFGGYVIAALGFRVFFLTIAALSVASALLLLIYVQRTKNAPAPAEHPAD
jgi:MFS family permease